MMRVCLATLLTAAASAADSLLISEIAEGSSYNKYFEIYNHGKAAVSLSGWKIQTKVNGKNVYTFLGANMPTDDIPAGKGRVWCDSKADASILKVCDVVVTYGKVKPTAAQTAAGVLSAAVSFNGDDSLLLYKGTTLVDVVGGATRGPWSVAGVSGATKDRTLVRKYAVAKGNPLLWEKDGSKGSGGTSAGNSEWIVHAKNVRCQAFSAPAAAAAAAAPAGPAAPADDPPPLQFWKCLGSYDNKCSAAAGPPPPTPPPPPPDCKGTGIGKAVGGWTTLSATKQCSYNTKNKKRLLYETFNQKCTPAACAAACDADGAVHTGTEKCVAFYMYTTSGGATVCRGINGVPDQLYSR